MSTDSTTSIAASSPARVDWYRAPVTHFVVVTALALLPRLCYLVEIRSWPFFLFPVLDSRTQWKWAGILLETHLIGNPEVTAKAPLYSYFLAFCRWLSATPEQGLFAAHLLQLILGAVTCGLVYLIGRKVFSPVVGLLAGIMLAGYSPGLYRDGQLLDTALATFLLVTFTLLLLRAFDQPQLTAEWIGAGIALGLLGVTRPNMLLLVVPAIGAMWWWLRREVEGRTIGRAVVVLLAFVVLPTALTTARNYLITGRFLPSSTMGGINLYTGNNLHSDGYSPIPSGLAWERTWYQAGAAGATSNVAMDHYWRGQAFRFWREHPGKAMALYGRKLYLFWIAHEIPNNVSYDWGRRHAKALRRLPLTFALVAPLGLLGMALGGGRNRRAWLLFLNVICQLLALAVFFVAGRYRMPAVPLLCVFAGYALVEGARLIRGRRYRTLVASLAGLIVAGVIVNSDLYRVEAQGRANRDYYYLAQSYQMAERYEDAAQALRQAVAQHPDDPDAFALLGETEMMLGHPQKAADALKMALEIAPDFARAGTVLGRLTIERGWPPKEAERLLRRALEKQPRNVQGFAMLVRLDLRLGHRAQAADDLTAAAAVLSQLNLADTRNQQSAQVVMAAAVEAQAAGVPIPATLMQGSNPYR